MVEKERQEKFNTIKSTISDIMIMGVVVAGVLIFVLFIILTISGLLILFAPLIFLVLSIAVPLFYLKKFSNVKDVTKRRKYLCYTICSAFLFGYCAYNMISSSFIYKKNVPKYWEIKIANKSPLKNSQVIKYYDKCKKEAGNSFDFEIVKKTDYDSPDFKKAWYVSCSYSRIIVVHRNLKEILFPWTTLSKFL